MAVSSVSFSRTPQATGDSGAVTENSTIVLDVMQNDLGGAARSLYSIAPASETDLLIATSFSTSLLGATLRIVDGAIVYDTSTSSALDALAAGEVATDTFVYAIRLGNGTISTAEVTITVTGSNDGPVVAAADVSGAVTEALTPGAALVDAGTIAFSDVDLSDVHAVGPVSASAGALGTLTAAVTSDSTGHGTGGVITWNYAVAAAAVEYLAAGETKVETFSFDLSDGQGGLVTRTVAVTITGTNDAPVVATEDVTGGVTEAVAPAGDLTDAGTIAFADVDLTDVHAIGPVTASAGALGSLTASVSTDTTGNGTGGVIDWNYSVAAAAVEYLAAGETKSESFTFTLDDGHGGSVERTVAVTITGTNDGPLVASDDVSGALIEADAPAGELSDSGTIAFSDVDLRDLHAVGAVTASAGALGTLTAAVTADTTGSGTGGVVSWNYSVASGSVEYLAAGEAKVESFTFSLDDGNGGSVERTVEVTIAGTNDGPVIGNADLAGAVTEAGTPAGPLTDRGTIAFGDVDLSDAHTVGPVTASAGTLGTLSAAVTADTTGSGTGGVIDWNYSVAAADVESLAAGETQVERFSFDLQDGQGGSVTRTVSVTLTGTNDGPLAAADRAGVVEAGVDPGNTPFPGTPSAEGNVLSNDVDVDHGAVLRVVAVDGQASRVGAVLTGKYGSVSIAADGSYAYTLDNGDPDTIALAQGAAASEAFSYTVSDEFGATSTATLAIDIQGTNDAPTAAADSNGTDAVVEAGVQRGGGVMEVQGALVNNHYTEEGLQAVGYSPYPFESHVHYTSAGGGDIALMGHSGGTDVVRFSRADNTLFDLNALDVDELYGVVALRGSNGTVVQLNGTGHLELGSAFRNVSYVDLETGVNGTNGQASLDNLAWSHAGGSSSFAGDSTAAGNVLANDTDPDAGALKSVVAVNGQASNLGTTVQGTYGSLVIASDGSYTYTLDNADADTNALAEGATVSDVFAYTMSDQFGATSSSQLSIAIRGTNDGPVVTAASAAGAILEGASTTASGSIAFADVDRTDTHSVAATAQGANYLGVFTAALADDTTGDGAGQVEWSFSVDPASIQYLAAGETLTQNYRVVVTDGNGGAAEQLVTVTITGTNDAPVITSAVASGAASEDGPLSVGGNIAFSDGNLGDAHTVSAQANGAGYVGTFSAVLSDPSTGDGAGMVAWTFDVDGASVQHLRAGEVLSQAYTVTISDGRGGTVNQQVAVTIAGRNDAPVAKADSVATLEDTAVTLDVRLNDGDVDTGDTLTVTRINGSAIAVDGTVALAGGATVKLNADGTLTYAPGANENGTKSFSYTVADSSGATSTASASVVIAPVNDAPTVQDVTLKGGTGTATLTTLGVAFGGYYGNGDGQVVFQLSDLNGDGRPETVTGSESLDSASTYGSYGLASGDLDGDGDIDLVRAGDYGIESFTNVGDTDGDGRADFVAATLSGFSGLDVALTDLNGDGRLDIVSKYGSAFYEFMNRGDLDGDGRADDFALRTVNDSVGYAYGITAGDLDGDGRGDVVIANWSGGPVELRFNRGDSNGDGQIDYFVQMIEDAYDESGIGVDLGDVDGDGDLDFVLSRWDLQNEIVYLNAGDADGDGQLAFTTIELPTGGYTLESEFADIDADGDLDVISSDYDGAVRVSYNRGDRNGDARPDFDVQVVGGGASGSYGVAVGDIDGDGDLDIVTPSWGGESRYLANQGDANGDGKLEFAPTSLVGVIPSWDAEILAGGTAGGGAIREDGPAVTGKFDGNDVDGDALGYQILSAPQEGAVVNNGDGTFSFDPGDAFQELRAGETRDVSFQYRAVDPHGAVSNTGTVTVTVNGVNDVPLAVADTATTNEDTAVTLAVLANDSDVEGESLSVSQVNGQAIAVGGSVALAEGANVRLNADGTLTYTPGANVHGTRSFAYTVTDASGGSTTANASVAIASVNDAPVAADDVNIKASLVANSGFEATPNFAGWTVNTGASSTNFLGYSGSATIQRDATTGNAVAVLSLNGTVNQPGGSGYGPTIRSDAFNGSVGDTVSFDWQLSSGSDWALGNGFVKNAATGAIVATVFNFNTGFSGSTGWRHTDVSLNASGNFYMEFQVGSYDSTFGQAVGATMQLDFAGVLPQIHEDKILTLKPQDLVANDQDPDGDALTIVDVADYSVLGSRVTVNADGTISYDPTGALNALDLGQTVTDSFLYTVSDGHGGTDTAAVSFNVQGRGDAVPAEDDFLFGTSGADNLNGAAGADVLAGLGGNDVLTDGAGNDTFLISAGSGRDMVTDFQSTDVVKLIGLGWSGFNDVTAHAVQDGANVVIDLEAGNTLTLVGVNLSALQADDFLVL